MTLEAPSEPVRTPHFIGGNRQIGLGDGEYIVNNPATGRALTRVPLGTAAECAAAVLSR